MKNKLKEGLESIGIYDTTKAEKLFQYAKELELSSEEFGLSTIVDIEEIIVRHIFDSLVAVPHIQSIKTKMLLKEPLKKSDFTIADIGSGGGIPGIPLSIILDDTNFVLAERMTKRCSFLSRCKENLQLKNVSIETIEAERIAQKRFDICVFRAFRPLDKKMTRVLLRILKEDGSLVAYKAKKEKITEEMSSIQQWVQSYEVIPLQVPFLENHERHLVVIKKPNSNN